MTLTLESGFIWKELAKQLFGVLSMVTTRGEARSVGIVYVVHQRKLYIGTGCETWKARHVQLNPNVSMTVPIAKRIPLLPWIKIPSATITFSGRAVVTPADQNDPEILRKIFRGKASDLEMVSEMCLIEIQPIGEFITYGIGVRLVEMMDQEKARGRAPVK